MADHRLAKLGAWLRVAAALVGTLPLAVLSGAFVARFAPFAESTRFVLGVTLVVPLWIAAMCLAFLARSAARAWALSAVLGVIVYGVS